MPTPIDFAPSTTARSLRGVHRWAWATLAFFILVVLEGAVVRATSSGAGCGAHWPLCNNEIIPHHPRLATVIEFTHRSLTGISTAMFTLLIGWTFYATPRRHPARRTAVAAGLLLLSEGALGAVLVLKGLVENNISALRVVMQSVHFTNTLLLLGATAATAVLLEPLVSDAGNAGPLSSTQLGPGATRPELRTWAPGTAAEPRSQRKLRLAALLAILATILTGATGSLAALADTLYPSPDLRTALAADFAAHSPLLIRMRWMHPASSGLAALTSIALALYLARAGHRRTSNLLLINLAAQFVLGIADVLLLAPTWLQVLHLLSADIFWITLIAIATRLMLACPPSARYRGTRHRLTRLSSSTCSPAKTSTIASQKHG